MGRSPRSAARQVGPVIEALADPTRREVVTQLRRGPRRASQLADAAGTARPAMSKHLRVLLEAGVVAAERPARDARTRVFRLRSEPLRDLREWLSSLEGEWTENLSAFRAHMEKGDPSR